MAFRRFRFGFGHLGFKDFRSWDLAPDLGRPWVGDVDFGIQPPSTEPEVLRKVPIIRLSYLKHPSAFSMRSVVHCLTGRACRGLAN